MLTAVVTRGTNTQVRLVSNSRLDTVAAGDTAVSADGEGGHAKACEFPEKAEDGSVVCGEGPSPILPEAKEAIWGGGSFIVMAVALTFVLVPKVRKGMKARYDHIEDGKAKADSIRAAARADVAQYESSLATVKAEAHERVEAARQQLEAERSAKIAEANEAISARRDASNAESVAARHAVQDQVSAAVQDVTARTLELALGRTPDPDKVRAAVDNVMSSEVVS